MPEKTKAARRLIQKRSIVEHLGPMLHRAASGTAAWRDCKMHYLHTILLNESLGVKESLWASRWPPRLCFFSASRTRPEQSGVTGASASSPHRRIESEQPQGSVGDYVQVLNRPVTISKIGASVHGGRVKLLDGHEVSDADVTDVEPKSPAATAGILSGNTALPQSSRLLASFRCSRPWIKRSVRQ
jgi:hypothetical protein